MKTQTKWGFRLGVAALGGLWLLMVAASWSEASDTANSASSEDDEYSFNWLDPEKKIYVLQNRKYLKAERGMLSGLVGPGISNAYRTTLGVSGRLGYYFQEWLGIEAFYTHIGNSANKTFETLAQATSNLVPVVREIRSQAGVTVQYVPWYAKINVFNRILYFDWYFSGGMGALRTELDTRTNASSPSVFKKENFMALYLGTGHMFHLNHSVLVRLDFTGAFYQAPKFGNAGDKSWFSNYVFGFGLGLKL